MRLLVAEEIGPEAVPPSPTEVEDEVQGTAYRSLVHHSIWEYPKVLRDACLGKVNLFDGESGLSKWAWTRRYIDVSRLTLLNMAAESSGRDFSENHSELYYKDKCYDN
jgi:hypothetical protein